MHYYYDFCMRCITTAGRFTPLLWRAKSGVQAVQQKPGALCRVQSLSAQLQVVNFAWSKNWGASISHTKNPMFLRRQCAHRTFNNRKHGRTGVMRHCSGHSLPCWNAHMLCYSLMCHTTTSAPYIFFLIIISICVSFSVAIFNIRHKSLLGDQYFCKFQSSCYKR